MRADIVPGAHFPDYELTDHTRTRRQLSEIQGIDLMIVILSRGHYCPEDCTPVNKGAQVIAMRCRISSGVASRPRLRSAAVRGV